MDHENGDNRDNRLENLRWLCPNCHSQTPTYKMQNCLVKGVKKVEDDIIVDAIKKHVKISEVLHAVGLRERGGNYNRIYRLMAKNNLSFPDKTKYCIDCGKKIDKQSRGRCRTCYGISTRKVQKRPNNFKLIQDVQEFGFCGTGRKYGVSDNAIRHWLKVG
jgi:PHP family Zn ribbon phosphoesterase